ncbi:MAG: Uma2 family endonuclease [bacterium]
MSVQVLKRLFTVEDYHRMGEAGILSEDDRVELLEGEIVQMTPIGSKHAACVRRLAQLLSERVARRAIFSVQDPIRLNEHSEPQPDLTLLEPRPDFFAQDHPRPGEILLAVEVSDTSADFDRKVKIPLYAQARLPEVWLVDLPTECIEVYRKPSPHGYEEVNRFQRGETFSVQAFPDIELTVDQILG